MSNGFIPVLTRLEELSGTLADLNPDLSQTYRYLKCREGHAKQLFELAMTHARRHEITFILQEHEAPEEVRPRKAVRLSQEMVYRAIKAEKFDLVGIEGYKTDRHLDHLLELARGKTAEFTQALKHELHHAMKFCGAFRACMELKESEIRAMGVELSEAEEFQNAVINLMGRNLRTRHEAMTLFRSFIGPARSVFATALILAVSEKEGYKKPALVMGQGHEGEFLALSLLWGFGARLINTTF